MAAAAEDDPIQLLEYDGVDEIEAMIMPSMYRCWRCGEAFPRHQVVMIDEATGAPFVRGESMDGKTARFVCHSCMQGRTNDTGIAGYQ